MNWPPGRSQRQCLMDALTSDWLSRTKWPPWLQWGEGKPKLVLTPDTMGDLQGDDAMIWPRRSLFPILAVELVGVVTDEIPIGICARCGTLRPNGIRLNPGQPVYCDRCRQGVRRETKAASERKRYQVRKAAPDSQVDSQTDSQAGGRS